MANIISICCGCGSVRNGPGSWDRSIDFRRTLPSNRLSHGICPGCVERLYPEMAAILAEKAGRAATGGMDGMGLAMRPRMTGISSASA
jgi:hypothetical protein